MGTLFDLSGIEGFEEFLKPIVENCGVELGTAESLAGMSISGLSQHIAILSDNRFSEQQTDNEILTQVEGFAKTGISLLYIGTPRQDLEFMEALEHKGVQTLFQEELDSDRITNWITEILSKRPQKIGNSKESQIQSNTTVEPTSLESFESVSPVCPLCIVLSGAPGCGTTFVGINLATLMATSEAVNYFETGLRPVLTTWLSEEKAEEQASLLPPFKPSFSRNDLAIYTRNPFGDEIAQLRDVAQAAIKYIDPVFMDLGLQEYLLTMDLTLARKTVRILVTTPDIHRCRYLAGLPADIVVVNQAPKRLPIDAEEFQSFWPDAKIFFVPYEMEQASAITRGILASEGSESTRKAIEQLLKEVQGGESLGNRIVG